MRGSRTCGIVLAAAGLAGSLAPAQHTGSAPLEAEFLDRPERPCEIVPTVAVDASIWAANLWPQGNVYYTFDANTTAGNQTAMLAAMAEIEAVCGVTFIPRTTQSNYINIRASGGNNSQIGMVGGQQTINIFNWNVRMIMAHELMHALGVWHEQQRADRAQYVVVNFDNIQGDYASNFNIVGAPFVGPYDFESVMHYDDCSFSNCCPSGSSCGCALSCASIQALPEYAQYQSVMGQRSRLSRGDMLGLVSRYGLPQFISIGGSADCSGAGGFASLALPAGSYILEPVSMSGGGDFDAWSASSSNGGCGATCCTNGWVWSYQYRVDGGAWNDVGAVDCPRSTAAAAFAQHARSQMIALAEPGVVDLRVSDTSCGGNRGGVSLRVVPCMAATAQPQPRGFCTVPFAVAFQFQVTDPNATFQWYRDGQPLTNAGNVRNTTTPLMSLQPVLPSDAGDYWCVATGACGSVTSNTATLAISDSGPIIHAQPQPASANTGGSAAFTVDASGVGEVSYQWRRGGVALGNGPGVSGAGSATLELAGLMPADAGLYDCVLTDDCGTRTSNAAALGVSACDSIDFNGDGLFPDNQDLEDYLSVFGGGPCSTGACGDVDFNNDTLFPDNQDLEDFLRVFGGGGC
ncbi:MAG TPA: M12 family metallopeptidase [Phycisphaerales bacterium]|nr:M12 family metallopeptidase [Phycisphaerales bacterium]